jgi:hypothetical protein
MLENLRWIRIADERAAYEFIIFVCVEDFLVLQAVDSPLFDKSGSSGLNNRSIGFNARYEFDRIG